MELLFIGLATAFNFGIIKWKLEKRRFADAALDLLILIIIGIVFSGTLGGMTIGMIASAVFSTYLLFSPPELPKIIRKLDE